MGVSDRKRREAEALRQKVLDAAEEIIARDGIEDVTSRRIAASIEYSQTVLYRLFDNKDDLMDHLIARGYRGVREQYTSVPEDGGSDPEGTLVSCSRRTVTMR